MRRLAKTGLGLLALLASLLVLLLAFMLFNTLRLPPPPAAGGKPVAPPAGLDAAARRLSAAIQIQTISHGEEGRSDNFPALHRLLETSFPLAHARLKREVVGGASLLYTWQGSDASLQPMLLTAHMDTVPVEPGAEAKWTHPPFSGLIADGYIWGRGTLDMKYAVLGTFEAVEHLLAQGYQPRRTILLAFGHDEEVGGAHGAAQIAALLRQRGVRAWFSLDEGLAILDGFIPGAERPVAQIGLSEKGYVSLQLSAQAAGGHSSMPPEWTAAGRIARAVARMEENPMPASLDGPGGEGLRAMAPVLPFSTRFALANMWLFEPMIKRQLAAAPATNAMLRTSTAPTMLAAGVKDNVLPSDARAVINFRLAPGDTIAGVEAHARAAIADPAVAVARYGHQAMEASPVADKNGPGFRLIAQAVGAIAPEALVTPGLVVAGTDSRHYGQVSDAAYRFLPLRMTPADTPRVHGTDERISVKNYGEVISFYEALMRGGAK